MLRYDSRMPRQHRQRSGMSVEEVARRAKLTPRGVRGIEACGEPNAGTLGRLASALGVGVESFFVVR